MAAVEGAAFTPELQIACDLTLIARLAVAGPQEEVMVYRPATPRGGITQVYRVAFTDSIGTENGADCRQRQHCVGGGGRNCATAVGYRIEQGSNTRCNGRDDACARTDGRYRG